MLGALDVMDNHAELANKAFVRDITKVALTDTVKQVGTWTDNGIWGRQTAQQVWRKLLISGLS